MVRNQLGHSTSAVGVDDKIKAKYIDTNNDLTCLFLQDPKKWLLQTQDTRHKTQDTRHKTKKNIQSSLDYLSYGEIALVSVMAISPVIVVVCERRQI